MYCNVFDFSFILLHCIHSLYVVADLKWDNSRAVEGILQGPSQFHQHAFWRRNRSIWLRGKSTHHSDLLLLPCPRGGWDPPQVSEYWELFWETGFCNQRVCSNPRGWPCPLGRCSGVWHGWLTAMGHSVTVPLMSESALHCHYWTLKGMPFVFWGQNF